MSKLRVARVGLVAAGGTLGTAARAGVALAMAGQTGDFPFATFTVNIVGAFLLGALFTFLPVPRARGKGLRDRSNSVRLFFGTGFLGGFTTYSALAVDTAGLLVTSSVLAFGYALATLLLGALATWLGIFFALSAKSANAKRQRADQGGQP